MSHLNIVEGIKPEPCFDSTLIKIFLNSVKDGDLLQIKNHIEKYNFDVTIIKDAQLEQNPIFYATNIKDDKEAFKIMEYFVSLGVNPKAKDKLLQTPIYYTARDGKYKCTEFLLNCGAPLNEKDFYSQTPIYYACRENQIEILKLLIESGAELNEVDKYGQTCIFYAIKEGHFDIVKILIENGADIDKEDKKKYTPYTYALKFNHTQIAQLLHSKGAKYVQKPEGKDKKSKNKKQKVTHGEVASGTNIIGDVDEQNFDEKPKKYILVRILPDGQKKPLNYEELEQFRKAYSEVSDILYDEERLHELEKDVPESLKNYESWEKIAKKLMNILYKTKDSELFHKPVDPVLLGIPDYFDVIKNPMDFSTIKKKLNNSQYTNCKEFTDDLDLVFSNCYRYNGENSVVGQICTRIKDEFLKLCKQLDVNLYS